MTPPTLGRLTRVDLRTAWSREDTQFTPWLAQPANVELLGEALSLSLALEDTEVGVGDFRADLHLRDLATGGVVLVENQLEATDHRHLGQLLTYAAGLSAATVVWIAARFREEHRAALDWLNEHTDEGLRFFGVQIEVWRIDDSPPAPRFEVVARPNAWARQVKAAAQATTASAAGASSYPAFWEVFNATAAARGARFRTPEGNRPNWYPWSLGGKGATLCARAALAKGQATVLISILSGRQRDACFGLLLREREAIERELGCELLWDDSAKEARISYAWAVPLQDEAQWPDVAAQIVERLVTFERVFRPRVERMDVGAWEDA